MIEGLDECSPPRQRGRERQSRQMEQGVHGPRGTLEGSLIIAIRMMLLVRAQQAFLLDKIRDLTGINLDVLRPCRALRPLFLLASS